MQRGKHQMSGECGLDRDFCRFEVSDLADQDDVRILSQERTQRRGEIESDRLLHLHLIDSRQVELDRIFRGHDVHLGRIHFCQC